MASRFARSHASVASAQSDASFRVFGPRGNSGSSRCTLEASGGRGGSARQSGARTRGVRGREGVVQNRAREGGRWRDGDGHRGDAPDVPAPASPRSSVKIAGWRRMRSADSRRGRARGRPARHALWRADSRDVVERRPNTPKARSRERNRRRQRGIEHTWRVRAVVGSFDRVPGGPSSTRVFLFAGARGFRPRRRCYAAIGLTPPAHVCSPPLDSSPADSFASRRALPRPSPALVSTAPSARSTAARSFTPPRTPPPPPLTQPLRAR